VRRGAKSSLLYAAHSRQEAVGIKGSPTNFIRPKVAKRDIKPEKDVAEYDYSKLFRGTGMHFSEKLYSSSRR
jgi:hypothetical protein